MNDTPDHILKKQFEICNSKTIQEKINGLFELTELSRTIIKNRIKNNVAVNLLRKNARIAEYLLDLF